MFKDEEDDRQSFVKSVLEDDFLSDSISGTGDVDDSSDRSDGAHLSKKERESALNMSAKKGGMIKRTEGTYCFWSPEVSLFDFACLPCTLLQLFLSSSYAHRNHADVPD